MEEKRTMNIETFGEIIDKFLEENHIQMLIDIPENTLECTIKDNTELGVVVQFYILLNAIKPIFKKLHHDIIDHDESEPMIDALLALVKKDLMDVAQEDENEKDNGRKD